MSQVTFTYNDTAYSIPNFRTETGKLLESFDDYCLRHLPELIAASIPEICTVRCSVSGFAMAIVTPDEINRMILNAVVTLKFDRFNELLQARQTEAEIAEAIETMFDHMGATMLHAARRAPSLFYTNGQFVLAKLPKSMQLAVLVNQLLFNAGQYKDRATSMDDIAERNRKAGAVADSIAAADAAMWEVLGDLTQLHAALVELDAKYRISFVEFSNREYQLLMELRNGAALNAHMVLDFVLQLTSRRDADPGSFVNPEAGWTKQVFKSNTFEAAMRLENSNIAGPAQAARRMPISPATGRPSNTPRSPEEAFKQAKKKRVNDALARLFGGAK